MLNCVICNRIWLLFQNVAGLLAQINHFATVLRLIIIYSPFFVSLLCSTSEIVIRCRLPPSLFRFSNLDGFEENSI